MTRKYKLLILDYGGVYSFPYTAKNFNTIILNTFGVIPNEVERQQIIEKSHLLGMNGITTQEYISLLGHVLNVEELPSVEQFENATIEVTNPPTPEMVKLVRMVHSSGIKVSLLSDMYMFEVKRTRPWGRYDGFDYVSFSAEAGMTKWDHGFFLKTLDYFQVSAQDALFVDDVIKNIEVANEVGVGTLFADKEMYHNAESLINDIAQLLGIKQST